MMNRAAENQTHHTGSSASAAHLHPHLRSQAQSINRKASLQMINMNFDLWLNASVNTCGQASKSG